MRIALSVPVLYQVLTRQTGAPARDILNFSEIWPVLRMTSNRGPRGSNFEVKIDLKTGFWNFREGAEKNFKKRP